MIVGVAGLEVVAAAEGIDATLRSVKGHSPDVILFALALPTNVDKVSEQVVLLAGSSPESAIIILTASDSAAVARAALSAGAAGYVLESEPPAVMPEAIRHVAEGQPWVSPRISNAITQLNRAPEKDELSARQQTIVRSIAWGHTSKEIAVELNLSRRTIEASRADILHKLDLSSRASLVKYAIDHDLFDENDEMSVPPAPPRQAEKL
jgi:DNA-binding NarL/FixJ family response regulator